MTGVGGVSLAGSWALVPHPDYPPVAVRTVRVDVAVTADGWRLDYRVEGAGGVLLPERAALQWDKLARFGFPLLIVLLLVLPALVPGANIVQRLVAPPAQALTQVYLAIAAAIA